VQEEGSFLSVFQKSFSHKWSRISLDVFSASIQAHEVFVLFSVHVLQSPILNVTQSCTPEISCLFVVGNLFSMPPGLVCYYFVKHHCSVRTSVSLSSCLMSLALLQH
jgi:hypothetical protein